MSDVDKAIKKFKLKSKIKGVTLASLKENIYEYSGFRTRKEVDEDIYKSVEEPVLINPNRTEEINSIRIEINKFREEVSECEGTVREEIRELKIIEEETNEIKNNVYEESIEKLKELNEEKDQNLNLSIFLLLMGSHLAL